MSYTLTAVVNREDDLYVALCPEFDIASQGTTADLAVHNLEEAVMGFLEVASAEEINRRIENPVTIRSFEVLVGAAA